MIIVSINDADVLSAFNRLIALSAQPTGPLLAIGEKVAEFTKVLFEKSQDPYGVPWAPNSDTTLRKLMHGSKKNFTKKGAISKRGEQLLSGKKPLIGESKDLSTKFSYRVLDYAVAITSPMVYAAMQNFGGTKAEFPNLWGDIPARQFFPDPARGMPPELADEITAILQSAILNAVSNTGA